MWVCDEEDVIASMPTIEVESLNDIHDRRQMKIWTLLVETPHGSLVDLEDQENNGEEGKLVLKRYYKHASDWCHYLEFDERLMTDKPLLERRISPTHDYFIQTITNSYRNVPD